MAFETVNVAVSPDTVSADEVISTPDSSGVGSVSILFHFAYTLISLEIGSFSKEFAVNGFCHFPSSQYQPSNS